MSVAEDPGLDRPRAFDATRSWHGGMNTRDWVAFLGEFQSTLIQDADVDQIGRITRRLGVSSLDSPTGTSLAFGLTLWHPPSSRATRRLVGYWTGHSSGVQLFQSTGNGEWTSFDTGISLVADLHQFQAGRGFYTADEGAASGVTQNVLTLYVASAAPHASGGSFPMSGLAFRHDIVTATDRASQTFDVRPRTILWWQGRLWAANSAATAHGLNWLGWSDVFNGKGGWTDAAQSIQVDPDDNDQITGLFAVRGAENIIYIWKERGVWRLSVQWDTEGFYTESVDILDTTQSRLSKIASGVGCIATRSIAEVTLPNGSADVFFLAHDGIRSLRRVEQDTAGGAGRPITDNNKDLIDRINADWAHRAVATVHKNLYMLAVPVDGSQTNNLIIVVDTSREELPAWTYSWAAADLADVPLTTADRRAYMQPVDPWPNDSTVSGTHVFRLFTGSTDPGGSAIPFTIETRGFVHGSPNIIKTWDFLEVQGLITGDSAATLVISAKVDESSAGFAALGHIVLDATGNQFPVLPFFLPFNPSGGQTVTKALGLRSLIAGRILELRLATNTGSGVLSLRQVGVSGRPFPRTVSF